MVYFLDMKVELLQQIAIFLAYCVPMPCCLLLMLGFLRAGYTDDKGTHSDFASCTVTLSVEIYFLPMFL